MRLRKIHPHTCRRGSAIAVAGRRSTVGCGTRRRSTIGCGGRRSTIGCGTRRRSTVACRRSTVGRCGWRAVAFK